MSRRTRRIVLVLAVIAALAVAFAAGFSIAATRTPPYRTLLKIMRTVYPAGPLTNPSQMLWRESYRQPVAQSSIVMLGDSITRLGNWPAILGRPDIINLGIPGDTTDGILLRLDDGNIPDGSAVFLMAGVNDVIASARPDQIAANLRKIVERLRIRHRVYLQSTLFTESPALNSDIRTLLEQEKILCRELSCTFIDVNAALAPDGTLRPEYASDGLHLSAAGYAAWAPLLNPHLPLAQEHQPAPRP